jgi:hypothetical protein
MTVYRIEAEGDVREVYHVEAESEDEAREMFQRGDIDNPTISEVCGSSIVKVEVEDV